MSAVSVVVVPSHLHETLVEMFRHRPALAAEVLAGVLGMELPVFAQVSVEAGDCVDLSPTEYRADAVVVLTGADGPVLAVVVEVQLSRDRDKQWSWPVYVTTLRARLRCPTVLLVVCVDAAVAAWAGVPIELGVGGGQICPTVLGPEAIPVLTDADDAGRAPELAVLAAMAHGADPRRREVLTVLVDALASVEVEHAVLYAELVFSALPEAARRHLEALMSTHTHAYRSEYAQTFFDQGEAAGEAVGEARGRSRAVLAVLDARGIAVPDEARARVCACRDLDQLDSWVRRAATADSVDELFG